MQSFQKGGLAGTVVPGDQVQAGPGLKRNLLESPQPANIQSAYAHDAPDTWQDTARPSESHWQGEKTSDMPHSSCAEEGSPNDFAEHH